MLEIKGIKKKYKTGELIQTALDDVSLSLRDNEFVAILGPSGSGKTTLLNIIGGLDRYDSGDLIINNTSTKEYTDRDWDSYRNHTIGFVFQSYNLIPHQSILANVELALTISGINRSERRQRAKEALEMVGLGDQLHKKPNQMSGGQMQRVAIARALVNNPKVLLADEPTGALDTETSLQVMELLKEVAKDRLVVMVTHNPELAEAYANRTIKLRDGRIIDDSNPYHGENEVKEINKKNMGKSSMSFWTSLSLSFNNLRTKKGRTILTALAGSIGIIGIALILSLSTGVNNYISDIQKDTMSSYPITISSSTLDISSLFTSRLDESDEKTNNSDAIYADNTSLENSQKLSSSVTTNNLTAFKKYLDDPNSEISQYLGENGVVYTYNVKFNVFSYNENNVLVNSGADTDELTGNSSSSGFGQMASMFTGSSTSTAENFTELMKGSGDSKVSAVITDSYDVLYGSWPSAYNEVVLVLNDNNGISSSVLYQLGLITADQYKTIYNKIKNGEEVDEIKFDYNEVCNHTFYLIPACDYYVKNADNTYTYIKDNAMYQSALISNALQLKITGVIKPTKDASNASLSSNVAYLSSLTDYIIEHTNQSSIVTAQEANKNLNVLNGMSFKASTDSEKVSDVKKYVLSLNVSSKLLLYQVLVMNPLSGITVNASLDEVGMANKVDEWISGTPNETLLLSLYDQYLGDTTYEDNISAFGKVSYDAPSSISIYTDSFEDKDKIAECITNYNKTAETDDKITYTDYVALMTSSLTSIVNVISYVLIAFVAVSLIVSCIMIGIITHISVLERTKEIGILRAIGASKTNISQVFNAETFIIGLCSGVLGIVISLLLIIPINIVIKALVGASTVKASLSLVSALVLILISVVITVVGGFVPAHKAAKKDPVIALRTE